MSSTRRIQFTFGSQLFSIHFENAHEERVDGYLFSMWILCPLPKEKATNVYCYWADEQTLNEKAFPIRRCLCEKRTCSVWLGKCQCGKRCFSAATSRTHKRGKNAEPSQKYLVKMCIRTEMNSRKNSSLKYSYFLHMSVKWLAAAFRVQIFNSTPSEIRMTECSIYGKAFECLRLCALCIYGFIHCVGPNKQTK